VPRSLAKFPLNQLPKKLKAFLKRRRAEKKKRFPLNQLPKKLKVNHADKLKENQRVSIKSTSEEAKSSKPCPPGQVVNMFPLNQLPKKLKDQNRSVGARKLS